MSDPSISICILNYNYGRFLGQAIDSALSQVPGNYRLAEVLVIDDGSTDDSLTVCARFGKRVRVVVCPHRGFADTLTEAVRQARGEWIALLDADDWFTADKLAAVTPGFTADGLLVQHWEHVVGADGGSLLDRPHPGGNTSTLVVRREAALDLLPVTNELFFHVFGRLGRGVQLTDPLIHYRIHDRNMTDRTHPGVMQDYLRAVSADVAARCRTLASTPPTWASERQLRLVAWHFAAVSSGHAREAAIQRDQRWPALRAASTELVRGVLARRAAREHMVGIRAAILMRATARLGGRPA